MWRFLYNTVGVTFLRVLFRGMGMTSRKAARAIRGRDRLFEELERKLAPLPKGTLRAWFHSSSMGEFEQAKPIIAGLKKRYPGIQIVVSFFSPSGYEHSQTYKPADAITYIPFDSRANAKRFIGLIAPSVAIFVRYDVWPNHLWELQRRGVPTFIANATLRPKFHHALPLVRTMHRALYDAVDHILTVSPADEENFRSLGLRHATIKTMGDTRYDQVLQRSDDSRLRQILSPQLLAGKKVLVIGSSWEEDENVLFPACYELCRQVEGVLIILVPHEPTPETMERIELQLNGHLPHIRFSELTEYRNEPVVLIDSIGILMALYRYGRVAYVGGSFRQGIHNVLEPAIYGIPVLFGPEHRNSQEAVALLGQRAAAVGTDSAEFATLLITFFTNDGLCREYGERGKNFVLHNVGATERFLVTVDSALAGRKGTP